MNRLKKAAKSVLGFGAAAVVFSFATKGAQAEFEPRFAEMSGAGQFFALGLALVFAVGFLASIWFGVGATFAHLLDECED